MPLPATAELAHLDQKLRLRAKSGAWRWFHLMADPHVLPDGRVGFIDFGIVGRISPVTWRAVEALLGLSTSDTLRYADKRLGQHRAARLVRVGEVTQLDGFMLAGDTRAEAWLKPLLQDELPADAYGPTRPPPEAGFPDAPAPPQLRKA